MITEYHKIVHSLQILVKITLSLPVISHEDAIYSMLTIVGNTVLCI